MYPQRNNASSLRTFISRALGLLTFFILITSCRKDIGKLPLAATDTTRIIKEFTFAPCSLLKEPGTGWRDSTFYTDRDLWRVFTNPVNADEIVYVAAFQLYNYNTRTKSRKLLHPDVQGMPSLNRSGWLTFCDGAAKIYRIKTNGDSLQFLNNVSFNPIFDNTGDYIYFVDNNNVLLKMKADGSQTDTVKNYPTILAFCKKSNKVISGRNSFKELFLKDMVTGVEKTLLVTNGIPRFWHLTVDNDDRNIYWWDTHLYKLDLTTLQLDTLVKGCPAGDAFNPANANTILGATNISPNSDQLTFVYKVSVPVTSNKKYTLSYALQMNLKTKKIYEIKLFN